MPRNSISRRVARAASIGGSRSYRQRTPVGWYTILVAVCVIGIGLIVYSRQELQNRAAASSTTTSTTTTTQPSTPPTATDHWQVALSVDICNDVFNLPKSKDQTSGIITNGDGVVDIQPIRAGADASHFEGSNANLGKFLTSEGVRSTSISLVLPKSVGRFAGTYTNGRKCGTKPGSLQLYLWPSDSSATPVTTTYYPGITYGNGELYMLAFVPKGAKIPKPTAGKVVAAFVKSQTTTTTTTSTTTTTTTVIGPTTTTKPSSKTTSTTSAGSTTTTRPASSTTTTS